MNLKVTESSFRACSDQPAPAAHHSKWDCSPGLSVSSSRSGVVLDSICFSLGRAAFKNSDLTAAPHCFTNAV